MVPGVPCVDRGNWGRERDIARSWQNSVFWSFSERVGPRVIFLKVSQVSSIKWTKSGAIIGNGDRKRAPFLVLGLVPWYGTIFLFLGQIAPSPAAHARTLLRGFSRMSRRGNGVRNFRLNMLLVHNSTPLWPLEFCLSIFAVSCSTLSEDRAEFRYVPLYIADRTSHYSNLKFSYEND